MGDGPSENCEGVSLLAMLQVGRVKTPALLTGDI